ncbi:hypothetical protein LCGC14_2820700, partial [marine sediment metagenome]
MDFAAGRISVSEKKLIYALFRVSLSWRGCLIMQTAGVSLTDAERDQSAEPVIEEAELLSRLARG